MSLSQSTAPLLNLPPPPRRSSWILRLLFAFLSLGILASGSAAALVIAISGLQVQTVVAKDNDKNDSRGGDDDRDGGRKRAKAKNVILFIGDGMGVSTIAATRVFSVGVAGEHTAVGHARRSVEAQLGMMLPLERSVGQRQLRRSIRCSERPSRGRRSAASRRAR